MSATIATTAPTTSADGTRPRALWRPTVVSGLVAAAATAGIAAAAHGAGVSLEIEGETIPALGFAQLTFIGAVLGGVLLAVLNRRSRAAGRRFAQAAVALATLSCVPSIVLPDDAATMVVLVLTHVVAAAIIIPVLARHART